MHLRSVLPHVDAPTVPRSDGAEPPEAACIPLVVGITGDAGLTSFCRLNAEAALDRISVWMAASPNTEVAGLGSGLGLKHTPITVLWAGAGATEQWVLEALRQWPYPVAFLPGPWDETASSPLSASDHLAAYSDLLIAWTIGLTIGTTDPLPPTERRLDPLAVVECKRLGESAGRTVGARAFDWSDNGPSLLIHAAEPGRIEVLHPYDCRPPGRPDAPDDDPAWQARGRRVLQDLARNLERFNAEPPRARATEAKAQFTDLLPHLDHDLVFPAPSPSGTGVLRGSLERIFRLRSRASALNRFYEARTVRLARRMFALAFLSAVALIFSDYWLPKALTPSDPAVVPWHRVGLFFASIATIAITRVIYARFARTAGDERRNDYRAVAEGLRVQFYWTAAGTGASVASNYLQRQRGEVSWVRCAVSAASFPYERDRAAFAQLTWVQQLALLRAVHVGWVRGQADWFQNAVSTIASRRAVVANLSFSLLWSGFGLSVLFFVAQWARLTRWELPAPALLGAAGVTLLGCQWVRSLREKTPGSGFWRRFFPVRGGEVANRGVVIVALMALGVGAAFALGEITPQVPSALRLLAILKNLAVAVGFLCGAWGGVMFFGENLRRYTAIGGLFQAADARLAGRLNDLAAAVTAGQTEVCRQAVTDTQTLLVVLGKEALADNTDWLLMRRNHPLEPIMV